MADLFSEKVEGAAPAHKPAGPPLHSETAIYRAATELARHCIKVEENMRRKAKPRLGALIVDESIWAGVLVMRANKARGAAKVPIFEQILEQMELVEIGLRHAKELKVVAPSAVGDAIPLLAEVGKQATALRNHFAPAS